LARMSEATAAVTGVASGSSRGAVVPVAMEAMAAPNASMSSSAGMNVRILKAPTSEDVLSLVEADDDLSSVNVATALHRLAVINKRQRAARDALLRDRRFEQLVDYTIANAQDFEARSVADVLWSFATLGHWPATLLKPVLTGVAIQLEADAFEAQHLSTMVWALAKLSCKPTRLLEQMETRSIPRLAAMNMQNQANLLWGFAKLNYAPTALLPPLADSVVASGLLAEAKPVEVADMALALGLINDASCRHEPLLLSLASRAAPDAALPAFSSRQAVTLLWSFARLKMTDILPEGRLDEWISAVRVAHEATPLLAADARNLERCLEALGMDSSWVQRSEMLNTWSDLANDSNRGGASRSFTEDELMAAFNSIDTDKSGDIDRNELTAAIKAINPSADDATIAKMLSFGDEDGDMQVSFDEFKQIMASGKPTAKGDSKKDPEPVA